MSGHPGHNTRRTPDCHPISLAWVHGTSQLKESSIRKLCGSLMCLAYFLTCYPWVLFNQALADVQSTGAVIKCLYCRSLSMNELNPCISSFAACPAGYFGANCSQECHCLNGPALCNPSDGQCLDFQCDKGWTGSPQCQTREFTRLDNSQIASSPEKLYIS